jgi:polar amino acid transport system substrate-binding protein
LCLLLITGCTSSNKIDKIKRSGKIKIFTNANFPPFEYIKGEKIVGVDIEISKKIAEEIGVEEKIIDADFDGVISAIASGKADIGIAAITINEKRKEEIDFSVPYFKSTQFLILPEESNTKTIEELTNKRVAVAIGYSGQIALEEENKNGALKENPSKITHINSISEGILELKNKKVDAFIIDEQPAKKIILENPEFKAIKLIYKDGNDISEEYGIAIPKNNPELLNIVNEVIKKMIEKNEINKLVIEYS